MGTYVYSKTGGTHTVVTGESDVILGSAATDILKVQSGAGATVTSTVERVELGGASGGTTTYKATANGVDIVMDGKTVSVVNGQTIACTDGSFKVNVAFDATTKAMAFSLKSADGTKSVPVTTTANTLTLTDVLNTTDKSTVTSSGSTSTTGYTLTPASNSVTEGGTLKFTLTAKTAPTTNQTFNLSATGDTSSGMAVADATDFTGLPATVVLTANTTSVDFSLSAVGDNKPEGGLEALKVSVFDDAFKPVANTSVVITDATVDLTAPVITAGQVFAYTEKQTTAATTTSMVVKTDATDVASFTIETGDPTDLFDISNTGQITLTAAGLAEKAASNDYETTPNSFSLGISAKDAIGNPSATTIVTVNVDNVDDDAPVLTTTTGNTTTIILNYNETLSAANGVVDKSAFSGTQTTGTSGAQNLNITKVAINGSSVVLTVDAIPSGAAVKVNYAVPTTAPLQDAAGNKALSFTSQTVTTDTTAPTLAATTPSTPADNAANVVVTDNIVLNFSETVKAGTGSITIVNSADATDTRTIDINGTSTGTLGGTVTFSGSSITINPTTDLKTAANYYVNVPATAITDTIGNAFAGITTATALNFATPGGGGTTGKTITLLQSADTVGPTATNTSFQTGDGDDTINGFLDGGQSTFSASLDVVNGGGGIDTLVAYGQSGTNTLTNVSNVEKLTFRASSAATFDTSTMSGFSALSGTYLTSEGSTADLNFTAIGSTTPTLVVTGGTAGVAFVHATSALSGSTDTVNLNVSGYKLTATVGTGEAANHGDGIVLSAGIETLNIQSTGNESQFNIFTDNSTDGTTGDDTQGYASATTLNVTGSAALTIGYSTVGTAFTGVKTVNLSASTGGVSVDLTGDTQAVTVTGGSGNDTVTFTGTEVSKTTGAADKIDLGNGTGDVLGVAGVLTAGNYTTFLAAVNSVVSNTEGVRFDSTQVNGAAEVTAVDLSGYTNGMKNAIFNVVNTTGTDTAATIAVTGLVSANSLTFNENVAGNTGTTTGDNAVSIAGASAGQTANITLGGATISGGAENGGASSGGNAFAIGAGVDKVVITSNTDTSSNTNIIQAGQDNAAGVTAAFSGNPGSFELHGATSLIIRGADTGTAAAAPAAAFANAVNFNASAFTGALTIHLSGSTTGDAFTGGSGVDIAYGWGGNDSLAGSGGNDALYGGAGKDTLSGGDGDDVLITGVYGVAGATDAAAAESLSGGAGTDKFYIARPNVTNSTAAVLSTNTYVISDFGASSEKLYLSGNTAGTIGTYLVDSDSLTFANLTWSTSAGATAAHGSVLNVGTLAADGGSTTVAGDLQAIIATTAAAGKIGQGATDMDYVVLFNSARDSATYAAVISESSGAAGWTEAADSMTLIKLTGVAVADLSATNFVAYTADPA